MHRAAMAERQLIVVLPGIGGSVLARPGISEDVVWDAGKRDIANLAFRPDRMNVQETPHLEPLGPTESTCAAIPHEGRGILHDGRSRSVLPQFCVQPGFPPARRKLLIQLPADPGLVLRC